MTKPSVLVPRRWPAAVEAKLAETFDVTLNQHDLPLCASDFREAVAKYDAVLPTVTDKIGAEALDVRKPRAKILANYGVGYSHIDVTKASEHGIAITNTPDGENRIKECFGERLLLIPYVMPGFVLARKIFEMTQNVDWSRYEGMVLMNHGLFTFADDARSSYEATIKLVADDEAQNQEPGFERGGARQRADDFAPVQVMSLRWVVA